MWPLSKRSGRRRVRCAPDAEQLPRIHSFGEADNQIRRARARRSAPCRCWNAAVSAVSNHIHTLGWRVTEGGFAEGRIALPATEREQRALPEAVDHLHLHQSALAEAETG